MTCTKAEVMAEFDSLFEPDGGLPKRNTARALELCHELNEIIWQEGQVREFETGATRDDDTGKLDYEGFLSPAVVRRYAEYMHEGRIQADGKLRDSDNWQKGIPKEAYMKSLWRHFMDAWSLHRRRAAGSLVQDKLEDALCAVIFNASGYLHELLKDREND